MRTTLSVDDDVLDFARALAAQRRLPLGVVISDLARQGLRAATPASQTRNGIRLFPARADGEAVTLEFIKTLLEETD